MTNEKAIELLTENIGVCETDLESVLTVEDYEHEAEWIDCLKTALAALRMVDTLEKTRQLVVVHHLTDDDIKKLQEAMRNEPPRILRTTEEPRLVRLLTEGDANPVEADLRDIMYTPEEVDRMAQDAVDRLKRENNPPLTIQEMSRELDADNGGLHIWLKDFDCPSFPFCGIVDRVNGKLVGVMGADPEENFFHEKDYGKTWLAYRNKLEETA